MDGVVVPEPADGEQKAEYRADGEHRPADAAGRSRPPVRACTTSVTSTATEKKVAVITSLSGEPAAQPDMPCPDVQPPAHRDP